MKVLQSSDYRIYFDDVRMDEYVKNWSAACGLRASDAVASITMYRTEKLEKWKGYLTQVRIFSRNVFSGKFGIVFEGELMNRSWNENRNDTGEIIFNCKGFYHWLDIPIPFMIGNEEALDYIQRFRYEAQNIDVEAMTNLQMSKEELTMKDKPIREIIDTLFKIINSGYYLNEDSAFTWANLQNRFKVMGEIIKEFRESGYLDTFTFVRSTQIDSFYVYLNQILTQMMFEFYQDRDGAFRIKNPSWNDKIMKAHVLDESIVQNASGFNDWENEPSRVLVIGGQQDIARRGFPQQGVGNVMQVPMGLYVGTPGKGEYFSQTIELAMAQYGVDPNEYTGGNGNFFDDISDRFTVTGDYGENRGSRVHGGTDFAMRYEPLKNLGVSGEVIFVGRGSASAGNWIQIRESIGGQDYVFTYMHLSEIKVNVGDMVTGGQLIGTTGNTGRSSGPHLHLEISKGSTREGGTKVDPLKFLQDRKDEGVYGGDTSNPTGTLSGTGNAEKIWNFFAGKGFTPAGIAGILGNLQQESTLDPKKLQRGGGPGRGLLQWTVNERWAMLVKWAKKVGKDEWALDTQLEYLWNEMTGGPGADPYWKTQVNKEGGIDFYKKTGDYQAAVRAFENALEKAGKPNFPNRYKYAKSFLDKLGKGGTGGGGTSATAPTGNMYQGTPYASTGGITYTTRVVGSESSLDYQDMKEFESIGSGKETNGSKAKAVQYNSFSSSKLVYLLPVSANSYSKYISTRPNGMNANLICVLIETVSAWKEKNKKNNRFGLMGIHMDYINDLLGGDFNQMFNPQLNIQHGSKFFADAYARFSNKVTFALAALYEGDMTKVQDYIKKAGVEDFSKVRAVMPPGTATFVDLVIEKYCKLFDGDYLKGDPHRTFYVSDGKGNKDVEGDLAEDPDVEDYESSYKPIMSDEERLYKVNLKISEQLLIRYDTSRQGQPMDADELVERYARYMMQLYRAESHGVTIPLSTCLPFLRPGFNAWLEPTRRDSVFYITRVSHIGSFGNGSTTTVNGGFVRSPNSFDDMEDNIFVGETKARAADFGEVVEKKEMNALRKELKALHDRSDEIVGDARAIPTLSKLYSSAKGKETEYTTMWSSEYTANQLEDKLSALYKKAPSVVADRKKKLLEIVKESNEFFKKKLLKTPL